MYEVVWGSNKNQRQNIVGLKNALMLARGMATETKKGNLAHVYNEVGTVIAVVSDDVNGITIHRLIHGNQIVPEDRKEWEQVEDVSPGFGR